MINKFVLLKLPPVTLPYMYNRTRHVVMQLTLALTACEMYG